MLCCVKSSVKIAETPITNGSKKAIIKCPCGAEKNILTLTCKHMYCIKCYTKNKICLECANERSNCF
jgi:hypothetical protein